MRSTKGRRAFVHTIMLDLHEPNASCNIVVPLEDCDTNLEIGSTGHSPLGCPAVGAPATVPQPP